MKNVTLAKNIIETLLSAGVSEFCLCAGARNSPFVFIFDQNPNLKVYHFFDERSAAFFALGRISESRQPVAVITTSGTAVAELLPATVEATYSSVPLLLVTADRPKRYRGSGAPQSIEQVGIFSYYIEASFDLDKENTHISLKNLSWKKPVHINVCFEEPLFDGSTPEIKLPEKTSRERFPTSIPFDMLDQINKFLKTTRPFVIVSSLPEKHRENVKILLKKLQLPVYFEGPSGLRHDREIADLAVLGGERLVEKSFEKKWTDAVIRIGGVPTLRIWRDLEDKYAETPVLSIGYNHYTGLSRPILHFPHIEEIAKQIENQKPHEFSELRKADLIFFEKIKDLIKKYPQSEQAFFYQISKLASGKRIYLGNSLPVRTWDLVSDTGVEVAGILGNRGANGIDGQVSTFLGWSRTKQDNWCILGDLTTMYDLNGLWPHQQILDRKLAFFLVNNRGGQIFQSIFNKKIFINEHSLSFSHWAKMYSFEYQTLDDPKNLIAPLGNREMIELLPNNEQSQKFISEWKEFCLP